MQDALEEKDRMLLKLLDEQKVDKNRQTELTQKIEDFSRRSRAEMEEWVKLCKHLKQQLAEARIEGPNYLRSTRPKGVKSELRVHAKINMKKRGLLERTCIPYAPKIYNDIDKAYDKYIKRSPPQR